MNPKKIKNLIFDLGGVIIDLDPLASLKALEALVTDTNASLPANLNHEIFLHYETGKMDDTAFRKALWEVYQFEKHILESHADEAWNKMLLDIPKERVILLQELRKSHRLYLLSNTNPIHILKVNEILSEQTGVDSLQELFDKIYYSYEMNMRKPEPEIFQFVLEENQLDPQETLFIDDNEDNIESARQLNIHTLHVTGKNILFEYFR